MERERSTHGRFLSRPVLFVLVAAVACSGVIEEEGGGPLRVGGGSAVSQSDVDTGETWSAGSISVCTEDPNIAARLLSIEPIDVFGQVHVKRIGVRITSWGEPDGPSDIDTHMVGLAPSEPVGLHTPRGFRVDTSCLSSDDPVGEIVVTLTKTGDEGGMLDGLRVRYRARGQTHVLSVEFGFALCGTHREFQGLCEP